MALLTMSFMGVGSIFGSITIGIVRDKNGNQVAVMTLIMFLYIALCFIS